MKEYQYRLEFSVRDYECDLAGMVNNAAYLNYIEHARHEFLKKRNLHFSALAQKGIYLVVVRMELDYLFPLRSGDQFYVALFTERISRLRFGFFQDIYRLPDEKPILRAKVIGSAVNDSGRPTMPKEIEKILPK